ncbi:male-specific lethal 1 homolog [Diachasma alloeum]|uniref:male-specific lethal 1 homolog n=1 Tax=Diachasma alloeum TaxID=454923 RepID=UPI000738216F|nr:male-specific lethal 1 homolog [Diachasma alloeum]
MSTTSPSQLVNGDNNNTEILDYIDFTDIDDNNPSHSGTTVQIDNINCDYTESLSSLSSSSSSITHINNCKLTNKAATAAYNMVAAMNEHLSSPSTTSNARKNLHSSDFTSSCQVIDNEDVKPPPVGILTFPCDFDHMYASMTDSGTKNNTQTVVTGNTIGVSPLRGNEARNNDPGEVKHLKELLLLHLDLIQQQSEQIVTKDKLLSALRQENETLKLRLERMDRRVNLQKLRSESTENSVASDNTGPCSPPNLHSVSLVAPEAVRGQSEDSVPQFNESFKIRLNTSDGITTVKQEPIDRELKEDKEIIGTEVRLDWEGKKKRRSDPSGLNSSSKRKRGLSCSSTISNSSSTLQEGKGVEGRKSDKKGKAIVKKESFLTTEEHYYTAVGDPNFGMCVKPAKSEEEEERDNLEVPNWRVKVYTSCYTMEGTENLDDEIFNKRHHKLENDERRRKRWDVQRIREQRHIEKLKQRQERQNHQATCYNTNHTGPCPSTAEEETITSLWPEVDQIQSLQVDPQLPVSAFGASIPSFTPSEFSLPWLHTARMKGRRQKRSSGRRKSRR